MVGRADQLLNFIAVAVEVLWQHVSANQKDVENKAFMKRTFFFLDTGCQPSTISQNR